MGHDLSTGGSILRGRLSAYVGRDSDRSFLSVLAGLILLWTMTTAVVFGCGAYQKLAAMPQLAPIEPSWGLESCAAAAPEARCLLPLPKPRNA